MLNLRRCLLVTAAVSGALLSGGCATNGRGADRDARPQSLADLQKQASRNPDDPDLQYALGNALFDEGLYEEAVAAYNRSLDADGDRAAAYCNRGLAEWYLGRPEDAIASYEKALESEPDDMVTLRNLVIALNLSGRVDDAIARMRQLATLKPGDTAVRTDLASLLYNQGKYEEAADVYQEIIDIDPGLADDYYNLGLCYFVLERWDEALAAWTTGHAIDGKNVPLAKGLSVLYWRKGNAERAWDMVGKAQALGAQFEPDFLEQLRGALQQPATGNP